VKIQGVIQIFLKKPNFTPANNFFLPKYKVGTENKT
jgi:hypothetical protein